VVRRDRSEEYRCDRDRGGDEQRDVGAFEDRNDRRREARRMGGDACGARVVCRSVVVMGATVRVAMARWRVRLAVDVMERGRDARSHQKDEQQKPHA
jgi:hypothetical protein